MTASQKHFEWLLDILHTVEEVDKKEVIETHIFLTQLFSRFDMRTTMLVSRSGNFMLAVIKLGQQLKLVRIFIPSVVARFWNLPSHDRLYSIDSNAKQADDWLAKRFQKNMTRTAM